MHVPTTAFGSSWPPCTFQLNLTKSPARLQVRDYTQKSYEDVRAREKKLAEAKSKRRKETRDPVRGIGCPDCVARKESITLVPAQRHEEQVPKSRENEDLDILDIGDHGATDVKPATKEQQCDLPQAEVLGAEHLSNVLPLDHTQSDVAVSIGTSLDAMRVSHAKASKDWLEWPVSDDYLKRQYTTTKKPQRSTERGQKLLVRLKVSSGKLFTATARPDHRHKAHKPKTMNRESHMARPKAAEASAIMRPLPSSRSGRKRFRPNHPSEDGYQ